MSEIFSSIILGIIQGLGEFLPISSSGHLVIARELFKLNRSYFEILDYLTAQGAQALAFDVALHLGTLLAVLLYFRKPIFAFLKRIIATKGKGNEINPKDLRIIWLMILSTIPGALAGLSLDKWAEGKFRNSFIVALSLAIFAVILFWADRFYERKIANKGKSLGLSDIGFKEAALIGVAQSLALIPGVSRSGATITAALFLGLDRKDAACFSFLLSIPIISGASVYKIPTLFESDVNFAAIIIGTFTSFVIGFVSIKYMLKYLTSHSYTVFVVYRIVLAGLIFGLLVN